MGVNEVNFSESLYHKLVLTGHKYFVIVKSSGIYKIYAFKNLAEAMVLIKNTPQSLYFTEGDTQLEEIAQGQHLAPLVYMHFY
ncbi:MAG: hypothetical protein IT257_01325 [Chitinophagaceae bacterium]|nr:hypothetical protein [Chitinophagaceae bacterium]